MKLMGARAASVAGPSEWYTGGVWLDEIVAGDNPARLRSSNVHFAPGGRTAWHRHENGQVIHVTEGLGRAQARGGGVNELRAGDTVVFEPGEWHWHGAAPNNFMTHIATQVIAEHGGHAEWGMHVSDEEYNAVSS